MNSTALSIPYHPPNYRPTPADVAAALEGSIRKWEAIVAGAIGEVDDLYLAVLLRTAAQDELDFLIFLWVPAP